MMDMSTIVDGRAIARKILARTQAKIQKENLHPILAVILVGNDQASATYVRHKQAAAESIGIKFELHQYPATVSGSELASQIRRIQKKDISGIIVQLPLPKTLDKQVILNELDPELDVDNLSWVSLGKLMIGDNALIPPAPGAILEILKSHQVSLSGKHVVIVGQGDLIGKPLTNILLRLPVTLTTCNKFTKDLPAITKQADILVTGVGRFNLIRGRMVKPGAVVIDAGVTFRHKKMFGDINFAEVSQVASLVTPTPGGVGPITVAKLLENTAAIASKKAKTNS
jgi:methylenetetrahydrofolate dehydrogenase (NADP+)/methenyltetrahydrofolate cyclohydrolase